MQLHRKFYGFKRLSRTQEGATSQSPLSQPVAAEPINLRHLESIRFVVSSLPQHQEAIDALIQNVTSLETLPNAIGMEQPQNLFVVEFTSPKDLRDHARSVFDVRLTVSPSFDAHPERVSCADAKWSLACARLFQELVGGKTPVIVVHRAFRGCANHRYSGFQHGMTVIPGSDDLPYLWEYYGARNFKPPLEYPTRDPSRIMTLYPLLNAPLGSGPPPSPSQPSACP